MADDDLVADVLGDSSRRITRRSQSYALYRAGLFGNAVLSWPTLSAVRASGWSGGVCIRDARGTNRSLRGALLPLYDVPSDSLGVEVERLVSSGIPFSALRFNQSMPNNHLCLQGEVMLSPGDGYVLTYTRVQKPMRLGFIDDTRHATGLAARLLLRRHLFPASLRDLDDCLEFYSTGLTSSSAVVEFSSYDAFVGDTPGRNTVIWEVRNF